MRPRHRPAGGGAPRGAPAAVRFAITKIEKKKKEKEGRMPTTLETRPGGNRRPNRNPQRMLRTRIQQGQETVHGGARRLIRHETQSIEETTQDKPTKAT